MVGLCIARGFLVRKILLKVSNKDTQTTYKVCSMLARKTSDQDHSCIVIVNFR